MGLLSNNKKKIEVLRQQYLAEMNKMTVHANGVRFNEEMRGRLERLREMEITESPYKPILQSSTTRPIDFGTNIAAWMEAVREEARKLVQKNSVKQITLMLD